jgi:hypothetical protein
MDSKKVFAVTAVSVLLIVAIAYLFMGEDENQYMVFVDEPETSEDMMFIACLSSIVVRNNYNPMFILGNGSLTDHQLWTIEHMTIKDVPKLLFTNSEDVLATVSSQVENVEAFPRTPGILREFKGFDGEITVASYKEALWVAPLANLENKMMTIGKSTYDYQENVWGELAALGVPADYIVVTNPEDYLTEGFITEGILSQDQGYAQ